MANKYKEIIEGKTVALVGPASYMQGAGYGEEINSHDLVVRINRGIESISKYPDDIGTRTDIYYSCLIERAQQTGKLDGEELRDHYGISVIVAPPGSDYTGISKETWFHNLVDAKKAENLAKIIPIRIINHHFNNDLAKSVQCKPNTGFLAIYDLLANNPKKLSIYGFSFYLDGFLPGQKEGVQEEKDCTEQEFANMAFNSKRHIQKNMWEHAKTTLRNNEAVSLDKYLKYILNMDSLDKNLFKEYLT